MITRTLGWFVIYSGFLLLTSEWLVSCNQTKSISKGKFNDRLQYNYSYFVYIRLGSDSHALDKKKQTGSCRVYLADIRSGQNQILEKIASYSCLDQAPVKIILDYDTRGKMTGKSYFITVTDSSYTIPVSFDEKMLFLEMGKHQMPGDYAGYSQISGFRPSTPADSIERLPFLKEITKSRMM